MLVSFVEELPDTPGLKKIRLLSLTAGLQPCMRLACTPFGLLIAWFAHLLVCLLGLLIDGTLDLSVHAQFGTRFGR